MSRVLPLQNESAPINWKLSFHVTHIVLRPFQQHILYHVRVAFFNQDLEVLYCFRIKYTFDTMQNYPFNSRHVICGATLYLDFHFFPRDRPRDKIDRILMFFRKLIVSSEGNLLSPGNTSPSKPSGGAPNSFILRLLSE